jgi:uncharacterized protein (TIRG00374 family)
MGSRLARFCLAISISLLFVWLAFRDLDLPALGQAFGRIGLPAAALYILSIFVIHLLRTYRWHLMVRALDPHQPFWLSLRISFLGFAAVFLVPLRLGELARPLLLKRHRGLAVSAGLGTVAVERTVDGLVMVLVLILAVGASDVSDPILWTMGGVAGLIFGGAALAFASIALAPAAAERFWRRILRPFGPRIGDQVIALLKGFIDGLGSLPSWRVRLIYLLCTLAYWGLNAWGMTFLAGSMGLEISYVQGCLVMALLVVGIMIPAGPGSIGTFHAPVIFALTSLFGFAAPQAQAYAITLHLLQVLHMIAVALPFVGDLSAAMSDNPSAG